MTPLSKRLRPLDLQIAAPHAERWMPTSVPYREGEVIARDRESGEPSAKAIWS